MSRDIVLRMEAAAEETQEADNEDLLKEGAAEITRLRSLAYEAAKPAAEASGSGESHTEAEARIMQEYRWGNLTPLGVANHLYRAGFRMTVAREKAEALATPPAPATVEMRDVLTYQKQPDNIGAWRIGEACAKAKPGGDYIDHGLYLLKELEARGYGIVKLPAALAAPATDASKGRS